MKKQRAEKGERIEKKMARRERKKEDNTVVRKDKKRN